MEIPNVSGNKKDTFLNIMAEFLKFVQDREAERILQEVKQKELVNQQVEQAEQLRQQEQQAYGEAMLSPEAVNRLRTGGKIALGAGIALPLLGMAFGGKKTKTGNVMYNLAKIPLGYLRGTVNLLGENQQRQLQASLSDIDRQREIMNMQYQAATPTPIKPVDLGDIVNMYEQASLIPGRLEETPPPVTGIDLYKQAAEEGLIPAGATLGGFSKSGFTLKTPTGQAGRKVPNVVGQVMDDYQKQLDKWRKRKQEFESGLPILGDQPKPTFPEPQPTPMDIYNQKWRSYVPTLGLDPDSIASVIEQASGVTKPTWLGTPTVTERPSRPVWQQLGYASQEDAVRALTEDFKAGLIDEATYLKYLRQIKGE